MQRYATDLELARELVEFLGEFKLLAERLKADRFTFGPDEQRMRDAVRLLEAAAGRLMMQPTMRIAAGRAAELAERSEGT